MFVPLHESVPVVEPSAAGGVFSLLWVIIALPALGAVVILLLGNTRTSKWAHLLGCATVVGSFVLSVLVFVALLGRNADNREIGQTLWSWVDAGSFHVDMALLYDPLSALFLLLITGVGGLIHIYSVGYMAHDVRRARFFAYRRGGPLGKLQGRLSNWRLDRCDPLGQLSSVAAQLGLDWTEETTAFVKASDRAGTGYATERVARELPELWRERLSAEQVDAIERVVAAVPIELRRR